MNDLCQTFVFPTQSQDVRLLLTKFNLLVGEERVKEYVDVGVEMLMFYFRDVYHLSNLRGALVLRMLYF